MERLDFNQTLIDGFRAYHEAAAPTEDTELEPLDRRDREEVIVGSLLKRNDDIEIGPLNIKVRIICPAGGRQVAYLWFPEWFGEEPFQLTLIEQDITDRAPADPEEDPMPCWPEAE